jgi:hypothetical protein
VADAKLKPENCYEELSMMAKERLNVFPFFASSLKRKSAIRSIKLKHRRKYEYVYDAKSNITFDVIA